MKKYTDTELRIAADNVFANISQLFGYYAWIAKVAPKLDFRTPEMPDHIYYVLAQNAVIDGFLINLRRLNEFFSKRPKNPESEKEDDLRAYHFGFPEIGRFLDERDMDELHKRIAHSTIQSTRHGNISFEAFQAAELALNHSIKFIEFIVGTFYADHPKDAKKFKRGFSQITKLFIKWKREAEASK